MHAEYKQMACYTVVVLRLVKLCIIYNLIIRSICLLQNNRNIYEWSTSDNT